MSNPYQDHSGKGHNIGRDQYTIGKQSVHYHGTGREVKRWLTNIPRLKEKTIGREKELDQLAKMLKEDGKAILVNGIGGVGKTTLAIEYVARYRQEYAHIVFLEQAKAFENDIVQNSLLLKNLEITELFDSPHENVHLVFNELANLRGQRLLVIDDANESLIPYHSYLPLDWHILVTSRQELGFSNVFELEFLTPAHAEELFYRHYTRGKDQENLTKILEYIDYHTLTIELLAKTADNKRISLSDLLQTLREKGLAIGRDANITSARSKGQNIKRIHTFLCKIFELEDIGDNERWLLHQFMLLPPIFHTQKQLEQLLAIDKEDYEQYDPFLDGLSSLKDKGWLIYSARDDAFKLHAVLQDVVKQLLNREHAWIKVLATAINSQLELDQAVDNPVDKFQWIPYAERLLTFELGEIKSSVQNNLASAYQDLGQLIPAQELLQKALHNDLQNFGENHPNVATIQANLALVLQDLGQLIPAQELLQKALQNDLQNFGENHPTIATTQSNLALVLQDLGQLIPAQELLQKALQNDLQNFGENHSKVATTQANLAGVLQDLGQLIPAQELLQKALQTDIQNFGENHPKVVTTQSNLALVLQDLGQLIPAQELLQKALQNDLQNFGENHPNVAIRQSNLALVLKGLGQLKPAQELLQKALQNDLQNFGENHPTVATTQSNLALVLKGLGQLKPAQELLQKALQNIIQNLGENHPTVAVRQSNLALVLKDLGQLKPAQELLQKALQNIIQNLGENHPNVAVTQSNLALVLQDLGQLKPAQELLQKALQNDLQNFGENHPTVATRQSNLAGVYKDMGKLDMAKQFSAKAIEIREATLGEDHPDTVFEKEWLAGLEDE